MTVWSYGTQVVIDPATGLLRPLNPEIDSNNDSIASVEEVETTANGQIKCVKIMMFTSGNYHTFSPSNVNPAMKSMVDSIEESGSYSVEYSHNRVPPECWVCGQRPAACGPNENTWFQQFFHKRRRTWMPVCEHCQSEGMELKK